MTARYETTICPGCGKRRAVNGLTDCKRPASRSAPEDSTGGLGAAARGDDRAPARPPEHASGGRLRAAAPAPDRTAAHP